MAAKHLVKCCRILLVMGIAVLWILLIQHGAQSGNNEHSSSRILWEKEKSLSDAVGEQQLILSQEMNGYSFFAAEPNTILSLEDLLSDLGGQPIINLILTTWRSGSTFIGDLINSHPGNYYHYEPLASWGVTQLRKEPEATTALSLVEALLNCNYTDQDTYLTSSRQSLWQFKNNHRMWEVCDKHRDVCWTADYLRSICRLFPFQSMTILRLRLRFIEKVLQNSKLNVRVVLLVRDPRATMHSRRDHPWCHARPDCNNAERLCGDLQDDYEAAVDLLARYPRRLKIIRYEDFSLDPYDSARDLFHFLRLEFHRDVQRYLDTYTNSSDDDLLGTATHTKDTPFRWRQEMPWKEVLSIQRECEKAMDLWGYVPALNNTHQLEFNPMGSFTLK